MNYRKVMDRLSELAPHPMSTKLTLEILRDEDIDSSELHPLDIIYEHLSSCSNEVLIELIKENIEIFLGSYPAKAVILRVALERLATCK